MRAETGANPTIMATAMPRKSVMVSIYGNKPLAKCMLNESS
jgi:hypothetical protein